jgi:2-polyprenyl-3-methyl-5-hydroxy-6-metoxy-1,4-benzoquinol methylase
MEVLEQIYSGGYWLTQNRGNTTAVKTKGLVQSFNKARLAYMIKPLVRRLKKESCILEIGCGSGLLAVYLKETGYNVEVTDIDSSLLTEINQLYGIIGYCGDITRIRFGKKYDAVILNNVLEHLYDPVSVLNRVNGLLKSDGLVFIEVPNIASFQFQIFQNRWFPLQLPEHLYHFSLNSLDLIAKKAGFQREWLSTFSPRISPAGYIASLFPSLRPEKLRCSMSKHLLLLYLFLQVLSLPLAYGEALAKRGGAIRLICRKVRQE